MRSSEYDQRLGVSRFAIASLCYYIASEILPTLVEKVKLLVILASQFGLETIHKEFPEVEVCNGRLRGAGIVNYPS